MNGTKSQWIVERPRDDGRLEDQLGAIPLLGTPQARDWKGAPSNGYNSGSLYYGIAALLPTPAVNDMGRGKTPEQWDEWTARMKAAHGNGNGHGPSLAVEAVRLQGFGKFAPAVARWEAVLGRPAPPPAVGRRLNPVFVEWMMGLPAGHVTDRATPAQSLRMLGNGVVPQQAALALELLDPRPEPITDRSTH